MDKFLAIVALLIIIMCLFFAHQAGKKNRNEFYDKLSIIIGIGMALVIGIGLIIGTLTC